MKYFEPKDIFLVNEYKVYSNGVYLYICRSFLDCEPKTEKEKKVAATVAEIVEADLSQGSLDEFNQQQIDELTEAFAPESSGVAHLSGAISCVYVLRRGSESIAITPWKGVGHEKQKTSSARGVSQRSREEEKEVSQRAKGVRRVETTTPVEIELRDYQRDAIQFALDFFRENPFGKLLLSAPTGTGKGVIQMEFISLIRQVAPDAGIHLITTRLTIIRNYLKLLGIDVESLSEQRMKRLAAKHGIYTYTSYRNRLVKGTVEQPNVLVIDECHHFKAGNTTTDEIFYFCERAKVIGFTATPFRATARATVEYQKQWDEIEPVISLQDAYREGHWQLPEISVRGFIDDDVMKVSNGQFQIASVEAEFDNLGESLLAQIADTAVEYREKTGNRPGAIAVPSVTIATALHEFMLANDIPAVRIDHKTPHAERRKAIISLERGEAILIHVSIIEEGFDLPALAFLIDAKPKMSPVSFLQEFGRLTRPTEREKYYVCLNRNIERHAYLLAGLIPSRAILEAQNAFEMVSQRAGGRIFGLERMGRFKPLIFQRSDGVRGSFYLISHYDSSARKSRKIAVVLLPDRPDPIVAESFATQTDVIDPVTKIPTWTYTSWKRIETPGEEFRGFKTDTKRFKPSPKQQDWWDRSAARYGLDENRRVNAREFQILPILKDLGERLL